MVIAFRSQLYWITNGQNGNDTNNLYIVLSLNAVAVLVINKNWLLDLSGFHLGRYRLSTPK